MSTKRKLFTLKDLAALMELHPRNVKKWSRKLKVPPTVPGHASNRWDERDATRLLNRWQAFWKRRQRLATHGR